MSRLVAGLTLDNGKDLLRVDGEIFTKDDANSSTEWQYEVKGRKEGSVWF